MLLNQGNNKMKLRRKTSELINSPVLKHASSLIGAMVFFAFLTLVNTFPSHGQAAADYFNKAANEYLYKDDKIALNTIESGLSQYPADQSMASLKEKILKEKEKQDQQNKQDQEKKEEEKKEQEKQEQQKKDQQEEKADNEKDAEKKEQENKPEPEETEEKGKDMEEPPVSREEKLKDLNLTEEKARMILEAMKNNEIQYIQQNKRKPTKKPDSSKPDW
jgi:cell division protein FtsN